MAEKSNKKPITANKQLATHDKKKPSTNNKDVVVTKGYTIRKVVPAQKKELLDVARAMHREQFGEHVQELFEPEKKAAFQALESGIYVGYRCPEFTWDCIRINMDARCFCGHVITMHNLKGRKKPCGFHGCKCGDFNFVPSRPEDVGEFWLRKRPDFNPEKYRVRCKCTHSHTEHKPNRPHGCLKCPACYSFNSAHICAACDRHLEDHETFFETEKERRAKKLPVGADYLPFAEMSNLRNAVLTGNEDDSSAFNAIPEAHRIDYKPSTSTTDVVKRSNFR